MFYFEYMFWTILTIFLLFIPLNILVYGKLKKKKIDFNIKVLTFLISTLFSLFLIFLTSLTLENYIIPKILGKKFNKEKWIKDENFSRVKMFNDLNEKIKGKTKKEVINLLGNPEGMNSYQYYKKDIFNYSMNGGDCGLLDHLEMIIIFDKNKKVSKLDKECQ